MQKLPIAALYAPSAQNGQYLRIDATGALVAAAVTGGTWGSITGDIANQTDLKTAARYDVGTVGAKVPLLNGSNNWGALQNYRADLYGEFRDGANYSRPQIGGFVATTHGESDRIFTIPFVTNDLVYLTKRGGTISTNHPDIPNGLEDWFDGTPQYGNFDTSKNPAGGIVITITVPADLNLIYGNAMGISFGSSYFRAKYVKIEYLIGSTWTTHYEISNNDTANVYPSPVSVGGSPITKFRYTLDNWEQTGQYGGRIAEIYCANYNSQQMKRTFLGRDGGSLLGKLVTTASTTNSAGFNIPPGTAPTYPVNGDMWAASQGVMAQYNNASWLLLDNRTRSAGLTGDVTALTTVTLQSGFSLATTLATVNSNVGTFGSTAAVPVITVNGKGLVTAVSTAALGTAATRNTGTSGTTVPLLDGANTWSATQTFGTIIPAAINPTGKILTAASTAGSAPLTLTPGTAPTTPVNGDLWTVSGSSGLFIRDNGTTAQVAFLTSSITGNAGSATKLATARTISATGDLTWSSGSFDGTANVTAAATLATVNSNVGTFGSAAAVPVLTINAKGLVTAVSTSALGTAATRNTGTSGSTVPLMDGTNTWSGTQLFSTISTSLLYADQPNNGTTGAVVVRGNASTNKGIIQFINSGGSSQWGFLQADSTGLLKWSDNALYHAGNLSFGTGLTLANGVLTAAAAANTTRFSPISATASGSAGQTITIPSGLTVADLVVFISGVHQQPTSDYTISGTTLTLVDAYPSGERIYIRPQLGQKGDAGNAGPYTAGSGILISNGSVISIDPANAGTAYTAGTGISIAGSTLSIDTTKVARKDVGQTHVGDHAFDKVIAPYLRSANSESTLDIFGGHININSNYGTTLNGSYNFAGYNEFNGTISVTGDLFVNGSELPDIYEKLAPTVYSINSTSMSAINYGQSNITRFTSSSPITVTVPNNFFIIGSKFYFIQAGTGTVTFVPDSGVTIQSFQGYRKTAGQFAMVTLVVVDTNIWHLMGPLIA